MIFHHTLRDPRILFFPLLITGCLSILLLTGSYIFRRGMVLDKRILTEGVINTHNSVIAANKGDVHVYHMISWVTGHPREGYQNCGDIKCFWQHSSSIQNLSDMFKKDQMEVHNDLFRIRNITTVSVYNIHEWKHHDHPAICLLPTALNMAESEESKRHRSRREDASFQNYDGYSLTHASSSLQRSYKEAFNFHESQLFPILPFNVSIPGVSFLASNCAPAFRNNLVKELRQLGLRVDGLGKCLKTENISEGVTIKVDENTDITTNYLAKKKTLSRYLFHLAIENDVEPGHITEKVYHALISGTVPIYLGGDEDMKMLSPDPLAIIFVSDYAHNISALAEYLKYLLANETAYERHRAWRRTFNRTEYNVGKPRHVTHSWHCNVCEWALRTQQKHKIHSNKCPPRNGTNIAEQLHI